MPCNTRFQTSSMDLSGLPDRGILADALTADGWEVDVKPAGATVFTRHGKAVKLDGALIVARRGGMLLNVDASGRARVQGRRGTIDGDAIANGILRAYAKTASVRTLAAHGLKLQTEEQRADGSLALTFTRPTTVQAGKVGI